MGLIDRIDVQNDPVNFIDPEGLNSVNIAVMRLIAQGNFADAAALAGGAMAPKIAQLPNTIASAINKYPASSFNCDKLASKVYDAFKAIGADPRIITISDKFKAQYFSTSNGVQFAQSGYHKAVQVGDKVYDAITGPAGMEMAKYVSTLESYGIIPVIK